MRILILLLIAFLPSILFTLFVIWALGTFGYAPLEPLAQSIGNIARPLKDTVLETIRNGLSHLPGGHGTNNAPSGF